MYPNFKQGILLIILYFISFAAFFFLLGTVPQLLETELSDLYLGFIFSFASPIVLAPFIIYLSKKSGISWSWKFSLPKNKFLIVIIFLVISTKILTNPLNNPFDFVQHIKDGEIRIEALIFPDVNVTTIIRIIGICFFVPLFEEIFWRKQIQELLIRKTSPLLAIVVTSVLFSLGHLRIFDAGTLFAWGLLFGAIYHLTKSLELSIIAHSICNLSSFFIDQKLIEFSPIAVIKYFTIVLIGLICLILMIKYLIVLQKKEQSVSDT